MESIIKIHSIILADMPLEKPANMIVFGDCQDMKELKDASVHLVVTSPPYFNAPFDYPDLFDDYQQFLSTMKNVARELLRVLDNGRIAAVVCDDTLIDGEKFPVVADLTKAFLDVGFNYRERITWVKPEGYIRISRRSGVLLQHPYPMYYYPDNLQESILIFQKGRYDYKSVTKRERKESELDIPTFQKEKWYLSVWNITNVLPLEGRLEEGVAAFPEEIPNRLVQLYSYKKETVLDPFLGSGTTLKVAIQLGRNGVGYEIDLELQETIEKKLNIGQTTLFDEDKNRTFDIIVREDAKRLRTTLQDKVKLKKSVKGEKKIRARK